MRDQYRKLPELNITGARITGLTKLDVHSNGFLIEWQGRIVGTVVFGRAGWLGKKRYQAITPRGHQEGPDEASLDAAARHLIDRARLMYGDLDAQR